MSPPVLEPYVQESSRSLVTSKGGKEYSDIDESYPTSW
jgi:hypothetical protein